MNWNLEKREIIRLQYYNIYDRQYRRHAGDIQQNNLTIRCVCRVGVIGNRRWSVLDFVGLPESVLEQCWHEELLLFECLHALWFERREWIVFIERSRWITLQRTPGMVYPVNIVENGPIAVIPLFCSCSFTVPPEVGQIWRFVVVIVVVVCDTIVVGFIEDGDLLPRLLLEHGSARTHSFESSVWNSGSRNKKSCLLQFAASGIEHMLRINNMSCA